MVSNMYIYDYIYTCGRDLSVSFGACLCETTDTYTSMYILYIYVISMYDIYSTAC